MTKATVVDLVIASATRRASQNARPTTMSHAFSKALASVLKQAPKDSA